MTFTISGGAQKNIGVGSKIKLQAGFLPPELDGQFQSVVKIEDGYPFINDGIQDSAVSPGLIIQVIE